MDGSTEGLADGTGDGSGVGLQSILSMASLHLVGQHSGQLASSNGKASQSDRPKSRHKGGRWNGSTSKQAVGHSSIRYEHSVGMEEGTGLGRSVGNSVGSEDGRTVGFRDGT